jgi:stage II sporulation protein D
VWEGPGQPYFASKPDVACRRRPAWAFSADLEDLLGALPAETVAALRGTLTAVEIRERDRAGRASLLVLRGEETVTIRGDAFRLALVRRFGIRSVRSTLFTITRNGSRLTFRGRGDGHGVGLCQAGALGRAVAGESPARIHAYYFPGTVVARTTR